MGITFAKSSLFLLLRIKRSLASPASSIEDIPVCDLDDIVIRNGENSKNGTIDFSHWIMPIPGCTIMVSAVSSNIKLEVNHGI